VQQLFQVFRFQKTYSKVFEQFLPVISVKTEWEILLPLLLLETLYESNIFGGGGFRFSSSAGR